MKNIFAITNFIDKARWNSVENYSEINYANSNMYDSLKILTHYIAYVTDHQMPFQRIWNIGGFVFSKLVEEYSSSNQSIEELVTKYYSTNENKFSFKCSIDESLPSEQKEKLQVDDRASEVQFKSRFVTTDFCSIYYTLYILEKVAEKSLIQYITKVIQLHLDPQTNRLDEKYSKDIIKRIAFALYILTYQSNKIKKKEQSIEDYISEVKKSAESQNKEVNQILNDLKEFNSGYNKFSEERIYKCKRVWCALRDYMKGLEFKDFFAKEMKDLLGDNIGNIFYLKQLELPGDVWNNNDKFISCNFPNKDHDRTFNKYLREAFANQENNINEGYVEQFDITFSLAPRMCERKLCTLCPYGILKSREHQFNLLCINEVSKLCPIILHSTGYMFQCIGKERCKLYLMYLQTQN